MTDQGTTTVGEPPPQYMIFLLVFFCFLTGLLGFLICHIMKKKGYRCRTGEPDEEEVCEEKLAPDNNEEGLEDNQDTVEQILKCIIENEANMEAFKEMLVTPNAYACEQHDPRLLRKESLGGIPSHHHTVHSGTDHNSCHLCVQGRSKKARRRSRLARFKARPGEQTVFSVGRFRVTHIEKKNGIQGSPNLPIPGSDPLDSDKGDDLSLGRPQEGYNLRNMFKDVSPEATNGVVKSILCDPTRRTSDPTATKTGPVDALGADTSPSASKQQTRSPAHPEKESPTTVADPDVGPDRGSPDIALQNVTVRVEDVKMTTLSPERMREFSVVRMVEPAEDETQSEDCKDEMMEMEDIKDCRVSQEEGGGPTREEKRRSVHTQHKW